MLTPRRRVRSLAVLVGTALCATLPSISTAHAATSAPTLSVTVNGTPSGSTAIPVTGTMNVSVTVTPVPGSAIQQVDYNLEGTGLQGSIPIQPGQCETTCTVQASIDTTTLLPWATGGYEEPAVSDGPNQLLVSAESLGTPGASLAIPVAVDNHRPSAGQASPSGTPVVHAGKQLTWTLTPSVSPTAPSGTTVTDVELDTPGSGLPVTHFVKDADGSWTVTADLSSLADGVHPIAAVAMDSNGMVSTPFTANLMVDNGFTLTVSPAQVTYANWGDYFELGYSYPNNWVSCFGGTDGVYVGPTNIELQVDGIVWQELPVDTAYDGFGSSAPGVCGLPALGSPGATARPLPFGKHTLTWVVTDTDGVKESVSQTLTVAAPLTFTWPTGIERVAAGGTLRATATTSAPDGFSTLKWWRITDQTGEVLASGTGASQPSLTLQTPATEITSGTLTLELESDYGLLSDPASFSYVTAWPTAVFTHLSASSVTRGAWVRLSASAWAKESGKWVTPSQQANLQYQWSVPGSGVWHNGSDYPSTGSASLPVTWIRAGGNACFRTVWTPSGDVLPATSAPVCLTVKP